MGISTIMMDALIVCQILGIIAAAQRALWLAGMAQEQLVNYHYFHLRENAKTMRLALVIDIIEELLIGLKS